MNWKMCVGCERCGQSRPPEQHTFRLQEGIPWDCTVLPLQQETSDSTPAQQGASNVKELGIALSISGAAVRHLVSKYTVLQRTPGLIFSPGVKLAMSCSGFILSKYDLTHKEYTVIALAIILLLSHLSPLLDESCNLKCPGRQLQGEKERISVLCVTACSYHSHHSPFTLTDPLWNRAIVLPVQTLSLQIL